MDFTNGFCTSSIAAATAAINTCASSAAINIFSDGHVNANANELDVQLGHIELPWQNVVDLIVVNILHVAVISELVFNLRSIIGEEK